MKRVLALLIFLAFGSAFGNVETGPSPRFVVHILSYIAADYSVAVGPGGKILSNDEYAEQVEFMKLVSTTAAELPEIRKSDSVLKDLEMLQLLIHQKGDPEIVSKKARALSSEVLALTGITVSPAHWPDPAHGKTLYDQNCVQCHGTLGHGDGPAGKNLNPPPTNFHDAKLDDISPFQLFNTIRFGVPGTGMMAFTHFADGEVWDLAFYLESLRYEKPLDNPVSAPASLEEVSGSSDNQLLEKFPKAEADRKAWLASLRHYQPPISQAESALTTASASLDKALALFGESNFDAAKNAAVVAYLDGIEPIEPRLRAQSMALVERIERAMMQVRSGIERQIPEAELRGRIQESQSIIAEIREVLNSPRKSKSFTFSVAAGIFLREGFEASLILITLLGVIRSMGSQTAALYVHAGWMLAVLVGFAGWFFSGWMMQMSGAGRETLEGVVALFAVSVLLYFGFWLHSKTEITRWKEFIKLKVNSALEQKNLVALGLVAFMGVFREAFETVLFLRALLLEAGPDHELAVGGGVLAAFLFILALSVALVRWSVRIPVRQLFFLSSWVMFGLAFILLGKGVHSLQESGFFSVTLLPWSWQSDLLGIFPTLESLVPQIVLALGALLYFSSGAKPVKTAGQLA